jgi:NgoMIV restriction enzyme
MVTPMNAPFVNDLCGFRSGRANTSDAHDKLSVLLGARLYEKLGVPTGTPEPGDVGNLLTQRVSSDLEHRRPDLVVQRDRPASQFEQYAHLAALQSLRKQRTNPLERELARIREALAKAASAGRVHASAQKSLEKRLDAMAVASEEAESQLRAVVDQIGSESMLKLDVAVGRHGASAAELLIGLSAKWSLRTDRAQDCLSQGSKLVSLRRGKMPHFALITMEPRPAMLALVADGSGSVDVVYHLALPALIETVEELAETRGAWSPAITLRRLVAQGRVRDYGSLVAEVLDLPPGS